MNTAEKITVYMMIAVGRHAVLADEAQKLPVVQDAHGAHGDVGDHSDELLAQQVSMTVGHSSMRPHEVQVRRAPNTPTNRSPKGCSPRRLTMTRKPYLACLP